MANGFFAGSKGKKRIALMAAAVVLAAVMIAGNIILNWQAPLLHGFFSGGLGGSTNSEEAQNALGTADELVGEIAEESIVLLENKDGFLPLKKNEPVNFFGWGSTDKGFLIVGGGSGGTPINESNPMQVTLYEAFDEYGEDLYNKQLAADYTAFSTVDADFSSGSVNALKNPNSGFYTGDRMAQALAYSPVAVVVLSRFAAENGGSGELVTIGAYQNGTFLELTQEERTMFEALQNSAFDVVVLLNTTNPMELSFLDDYDNIKACLFVGIPGQSGARAIPGVLYGEKLRIERDANGNEISREYLPLSPSGRLSDTYARDWQTHNPSYINAVAQNSNIVYQEGIYFGYKWYETADAADYYRMQGTSYERVVRYPFGYGLSYTTFTQEIVAHSWEAGAVLEVGKEYSVTVRVTNTGTMAGREVVQLYYTPPYTEGGIEKSSINLLAFDKTAELEPGADPEKSVQEVTLTFTAYDMASYDEYDKNNNGFKGYELDEGEYAIRLMANAHDPQPVPSGSPDELSIQSPNLRFETDPVTGEKVENRFTGDTAYANMPIDGSTGVNGGVEYLSRADAFANFPSAHAGSITSAASGAADFDYDGYNGKADEVNTYRYNVSAEQYLVTLEDGGKAPAGALNGDDTTAKLVTNDALIDTLSDWDNAAWDPFLDQLSQNDIRNLIGLGGFQTVELESVGKPRCYDTDGPAGFNNAVVAPDDTTGWTVFPAETLTGCSWSRRLTYNIGQSQGQIGNATKVQGWYAPGVNLHRSVYNSRNYEYYSEDGVLSGKLAAETIRGAKEKGLYCYLKHFVMSEPGQNANNWYTWTTEQTLRESYLKPFEICVKEGGANAMMSAFNKLGAVWCGYNHALLTDVLRTEWGFHGSVITDWYQVGYMGSYGKAVKAGNDLWLNTGNAAANINFTDVGQAYGARSAAKNILYTYIDTYKAAKTYQEKVANGEYEDPYSVTLGVNVTAAAFSPLFVTLWVAVDVVLALGIGACVLFMFLPKKKQTQEE